MTRYSSQTLKTAKVRITTKTRTTDHLGFLYDTITSDACQTPEQSMIWTSLISLPLQNQRNTGRTTLATNNSQAKTFLFDPISLTRVPVPIILPPGSFDVRLVLDSREVRSKTDRDYISEGLRKEGITPITRALPLGDILWIAQVKPGYVNRLRSQNGGDEGPGSDEVMLEHIMERKRLDDLIYSIKDGRYNEQKFRLKKSGIKHVTYIVEDFSISAERSEKYGEAVESVIAAMQVVSDIFVKQTSKLDNTIRYLARFTKELQSRYRDKHIRVVPKKKIEMDSYLTMVEGMRKASPDAILGTTFSTFSALCDKNDSMTLRDIYLKMLLCIQGVTADKAIEISNLWPTPTAFIEAYNARAAGKDKDNMVSDRLGRCHSAQKGGQGIECKDCGCMGIMMHDCMILITKITPSIV